VKSHLDNDSCLPIYKTITVICKTYHQTRAYGIPFFCTSSWWLRVVGGQVVVCGCAKKISKTYIGAGIVPTIIHDNLATTTIHLVFFMSWIVAYAAYYGTLSCVCHALLRYYFRTCWKYHFLHIDNCWHFPVQLFPSGTIPNILSCARQFLDFILGLPFTTVRVTIENFWARHGQDAGEKRVRTFTHFGVGTVFFRHMGVQVLNRGISPSYGTAIGLGDKFFGFLLERETWKEVFSSS